MSARPGHERRSDGDSPDNPPNSMWPVDILIVLWDVKANCARSDSHPATRRSYRAPSSATSARVLSSRTTVNPFDRQILAQRGSRRPIRDPSRVMKPTSGSAVRRDCRRSRATRLADRRPARGDTSRGCGRASGGPRHPACGGGNPRAGARRPDCAWCTLIQAAFPARPEDSGTALACWSNCRPRHDFVVPQRRARGRDHRRRGQPPPRQQCSPVVVAPGVTGEVVSAALTHYSLTGLYEDVIGAPKLRDAAGHARDGGGRMIASEMAVWRSVAVTDLQHSRDAWLFRIVRDSFGHRARR